MITEAEFIIIDREVKEAVSNALNKLRSININTYALFLADGEYIAEYEGSSVIGSPYVIDYAMDKYRDASRPAFLANLLNTFYSFPEGSPSVDTEYKIHVELMTYSHAWEARQFLKSLYRLAHLINGEEYAWDVVLPETKRSKFIIEEIKTPLKHQGSLFNVIDKGYNSSLRNAFAHSDYHFDQLNNSEVIYLDNYKEKNKAWAIKEITYNDWTKRFLYTVLLSYYLLVLSHEHRSQIIEKTGTDEFHIKVPSKKNTFDFVWIKYYAKGNRFRFR